VTTALLDQVPVTLAPKQTASVIDAVRNHSKVSLWEGAVRSGKTIGSLLAFLILVATASRRGEIVVIGRTRESVARNVFGPLMDHSLFGHLAKLVSYTSGAPTAKILGRTVHVMGASDARAEAVLRGLTVAAAYVDEATLVSEQFWMQLLARCSVPGAKVYATTNPDGPAHWFKKKVVDRMPVLGYSRYSFLLDDNHYLLRENPDYVAQLKREYQGLWYRRFILGQWVQADGAVYDIWDERRHVVPHSSLPEMERVLALGIDHGTTNPTRGILLGQGAGKLWAMGEWAPDTGLPDVVQSAQLRAWLAKREPEAWRFPEWVYLDPAAASFKTQLFADGITPAPAHNAVLPGIRTVSSLLAVNRLVVSDACPKLIEYIPGYVWDSRATDKGEDKPVKEDDHEVDALRYGVHSSRAFWRDAVPLITAAPGAPGTDETLEVAA
jgi:PBSX family phage terminase large subunit